MTSDNTPAETTPAAEASTPTTEPKMFDLQALVNAKTWARNDELPDLKGTKNSNRCIVCNRPMRDDEVTWVHMSTGGDLFPIALGNYDDVNSQGCFPVGNSCKKKIPAAYRDDTLFD